MEETLQVRQTATTLMTRFKIPIHPVIRCIPSMRREAAHGCVLHSHHIMMDAHSLLSNGNCAICFWLIFLLRGHRLFVFAGYGSRNPKWVLKNTVRFLCGLGLSGVLDRMTSHDRVIVFVRRALFFFPRRFSDVSSSIGGSGSSHLLWISLSAGQRRKVNVRLAPTVRDSRADFGFLRAGTAPKAFVRPSLAFVRSCIQTVLSIRND